MHVIMSKESNETLYISEIPIAERIIDQMEYDTATVENYAQRAAEWAFETHSVEVLKAEASICKNCRAWNAYDEDSKDLDVWIDATVYTAGGFFIFGVCLTDIWSMASDFSNRQEICNRMYVRHFVEER